jgi:hypothetical protein
MGLHCFPKPTVLGVGTLSVMTTPRVSKTDVNELVIYDDSFDESHERVTGSVYSDLSPLMEIKLRAWL